MVSLALSTFLPSIVAAAGNLSPATIPLFAHPKPLSPCSDSCSPRRPTKRLAFASVPPSGLAVDEEDDPPPKRYLGDTATTDFWRLKWDSDKKGFRFQTAVVGYRKRSSPSLRVDLASNIHVAGKEYYTTLQEELQQYDCVLYEMVARREDLEQGLEKTSDPGGRNLVGFTFPIFGVCWQTPSLNYKSPNWFHADIDAETLEKLQIQNEEQLMSILDHGDWGSKRAVSSTNVGDEVLHNEEQSKSIFDRLGWRSKLWAHRFLMGRSTNGTVCDQASDYAVLEALYRLDFESAVYIFVAEKLTQVLQFDAGEGAGFISERNHAAMKALKKAIDDGHNKIAILYGVGHMPDLGRRLQEEFDLVPSHVRWITAWSVRIRELSADSSPLLKTGVTVLGWFTILLVQALDLTLALALYLASWALLFAFLWGSVSLISWVFESVFRVNLQKDTAFNVIRYLFPAQR